MAIWRASSFRPRSTARFSQYLATDRVHDQAIDDFVQSVRLDAGGFDDARPELGLRFDERGECIGRSRCDDNTEVAQFTRDRGIRERLVGLGIELSNDF